MKEKFQFIIENQNLESTDPDLEQSLNELQHCTTASSSKSESFTMDKLEEIIKLVSNLYPPNSIV